MKKKIKDLTLNEINRICSSRDDCDHCPLYLNLYVCMHNLIYEEKLEDKIEVEEYD